MKTPGKLFEIIDGLYTGNFCVAINSEQLPEFLTVNKLLVKLFKDANMKKPLKLKKKQVMCIMKIGKLKLIDYID